MRSARPCTSDSRAPKNKFALGDVFGKNVTEKPAVKISTQTELSKGDGRIFMSLVVIPKVGAPHETTWTDPQSPNTNRRSRRHTSGPRDGRRHKICDVT